MAVVNKKNHGSILGLLLLKILGLDLVLKMLIFMKTCMKYAICY